MSAKEVRYITPPKLEVVNIGRKILCHRSMRKGTPNMSVTTVRDKIIAHNYGHGGSGWTLAPGSARYVNDLFITEARRKGLDYNSPITIIGAGIIGLFTAYDLIQKGYENVTIIAEKFDALVSHNAGALLAPVSMSNHPEMQAKIDEIGIDAYKFYADIALGKLPDFSGGARIIPAYFANRNDSGLEPYVKAGAMLPAKDIILDFKNGTRREMVVYDDGIYINTTAMMQDLHLYLQKRKTNFIEQKIGGFDEIADKFIINSSGDGAEKLNQDTELISVQGHLIMLEDQNPQDMEYMILVYLGEPTYANSGHKLQRSFYIFPKRPDDTKHNDIGIIGGSFIEGANSTTPNIQEFDIILQNAREFYGQSCSSSD